MRGAFKPILNLKKSALADDVAGDAIEGTENENASRLLRHRLLHQNPRGLLVQEADVGRPLEVICRLQLQVVLLLPPLQAVVYLVEGSLQRHRVTLIQPHSSEFFRL